MIDPIANPFESYGLISGEFPSFPYKMYGNTALKFRMSAAGRRFEQVLGHYGAPENSLLVMNPGRDFLIACGEDFGQESVIYKPMGAERHYQLICTNGSNKGKFYRSTMLRFSFDQPAANYTKLNEGFLQIDFDFGTLLSS